MNVNGEVRGVRRSSGCVPAPATCDDLRVLFNDGTLRTIAMLCILGVTADVIRAGSNVLAPGIVPDPTEPGAHRDQGPQRLRPTRPVRSSAAPADADQDRGGSERGCSTSRTVP